MKVPSTIPSSRVSLASIWGIWKKVTDLNARASHSWLFSARSQNWYADSSVPPFLCIITESICISWMMNNYRRRGQCTFTIGGASNAWWNEFLPQLQQSWSSYQSRHFLLYLPPSLAAQTAIYNKVENLWIWDGGSNGYKDPLIRLGSSYYTSLTRCRDSHL